MNENEIARIAAATHSLRPDWPTASLVALITSKLAHRPRRDVAVAFAWIACESESKTPGRVIEPGPWWKAAGVAEPETSSSRRPPQTGSPDECRAHPGEWRVNCRCCTADRKAARDDAETTSAARSALTRAQVIAAARADIAAVRTQPEESK